MTSPMRPRWQVKATFVLTFPSHGYIHSPYGGVALLLILKERCLVGCSCPLWFLRLRWWAKSNRPVDLYFYSKQICSNLVEFGILSTVSSHCICDRQKSLYIDGLSLDWPLLSMSNCSSDSLAIISPSHWYATPFTFSYFLLYSIDVFGILPARNWPALSSSMETGSKVFSSHFNRICGRHTLQ